MILGLILAHSWYSAVCCGGQDCHPVPCDQIYERSDGVYTWGKLEFWPATVHDSQDDQCHACVGEPGGIPRCLYIQHERTS